MQFLERISDTSNGRRFYAVLFVTLLIGLILRTLFITADAPIKFTDSQDVSTDPFAYTYSAKNKVDFGDANPLKDGRWVVYEKSTQTAVAYLVYSVLGTGRAEGNLVAVLMNLAAILLVALALKNFGSRLGALLFAFLASVNFTLTVFARIPFLEASQNLWLSASFYLFSLGEVRKLWYAPAGAAAAMAAFFGKMVALYAVGLYLAIWVFKYITAAGGAGQAESQETNPRKPIVMNAAYFYAAYAAVALFWLFFTYLPSSEQVSAYFYEQGRGLYGAPKALEDLRAFLWQAQDLLFESRYFSKLPIISILAAVAGSVVLYYLVKSLQSKRLERSSHLGWTILIVWYVLAYAVLFPFNYRPLRYQTTLMLPMMAMVGVLLALPFEIAERAKSKQGKKSRQKRSYVWLALAALWIAPFLCVVFLSASGTKQAVISVMNNIYVYTLAFAGAGFLFAFGAHWVFRGAYSFRKPAQIAAVALLLAILVTDAVGFVSWFDTRRYSLIAADRDIGAFLGEDAVLSGSYATALTQENRIKCVHHQFGVVNPDPDFFSRFPITHLVVDQGNEDRARKDYPDLMNGAELVATYVIRGFPVRLLRISQVSPNSVAQSYRLTDIEEAFALTRRGQQDSAWVFASRYIGSGRHSFTAETYLSNVLADRKEYESSVDHARKALEYSCGDPYAAYWLAGIYLQGTADPKNASYLDSALVYLKMAQKGIPENSNIRDLIERITRDTK